MTTPEPVPRPALPWTAMLTVLRMTRAAMPATESGARSTAGSVLLVGLPRLAVGSSSSPDPLVRAPTTPPTAPASRAVASTRAMLCPGRRRRGASSRPTVSEPPDPPAG